jgi:hypothetical protein
MKLRGRNAYHIRNTVAVEPFLSGGCGRPGDDKYKYPKPNFSASKLGKRTLITLSILFSVSLEYRFDSLEFVFTLADLVLKHTRLFPASLLYPAP